MDRTLGLEFFPFLFRKVEGMRLEGPIAARLGFHRTDAVLELVVDRFAACADRLVRCRIADHDVLLAEMVEQGVEPLLEQR